MSASNPDCFRCDCIRNKRPEELLGPHNPLLLHKLLHVLMLFILSVHILI